MEAVSKIPTEFDLATLFTSKRIKLARNVPHGLAVGTEM